MGDARQGIGAAAERAVEGWYRERGYEILARNWRVREGELDIVARRASVVVVCEVKARSHARFGTPVEAITRTKQLRIRRLAGAFLAAHPQHGCTIRFDVASVTPGGSAPHIDVLEGVF
ncbi:MAG TPA: YraN family protein [Acidimicrobiia bacterium]